MMSITMMLRITSTRDSTRSGSRADELGPAERDHEDVPMMNAESEFRTSLVLRGVPTTDQTLIRVVEHLGAGGSKPAGGLLTLARAVARANISLASLPSGEGGARASRRGIGGDLQGAAEPADREPRLVAEEQHRGRDHREPERDRREPVEGVQGEHRGDDHRETEREAAQRHRLHGDDRDRRGPGEGEAVAAKFM